MPLPKFQSLRVGGVAGRVEDNVETFARALTDERTGLLAHNLTLSEHARGRVFRLKGVVVPEEWVPVTLQNGFARVAADQFGINTAVRGLDDGTCEARSVIARGSAPPVQTTVFQLPATHLPPANGDRRLVLEAGGSAGGYEVLPTGAVQYLWGNTSLVDLSSLRWRAAGGAVPWPEASQPVISLGEDYPGNPEVVRVEDVVGADGVHMGPLPVWWRLGRVGRTPAIRLLRVGRVQANATYDIILSVLSA